MSFTIGWLKNVGLKSMPKAVLAGEVDPGIKMPRLKLVAIHLFAGAKMA